jgi:hypothetical protein
MNASTYTPPTHFPRLPEDRRHLSPRASIDRRTDAINYHYVLEGSNTHLPEIASLHDSSRGSYGAREENDYEDGVRAVSGSVCERCRRREGCEKAARKGWVYCEGCLRVVEEECGPGLR